MQGATLPQPGATKSIYQRLGGRPAVQAAAELMYQKLLADPQLSTFFEGTDLGELVKHQARRLARFFSTPCLGVAADLLAAQQLRGTHACASRGTCSAQVTV